MNFVRVPVSVACLAVALAGCTIPGDHGLAPDYARTPWNLLVPNVRIAAVPGGRNVEGPIIDSIEPGYTAIRTRLRAFVPAGGGPVRHQAVVSLSYRFHTWYDFTAAVGRPGELVQVGRDWRCKDTDCNRTETLAVNLPWGAVADRGSGILLHLISRSGTTADVWIPPSYATAYRVAVGRAVKPPRTVVVVHQVARLQ